MTLTDLTADQRQSIADATQFIRTAGRKESKPVWRLKAAIIDDMLERKGLKIDDTNKDSSLGMDNNPKSAKYLRFGPDVKFPCNKSDPEFIRLVGLLIYAADRLHGHTMSESYGEQIAFYKIMNENFKKYFGDLSETDQQAIKNKKEKLEKDAEKYRQEVDKYPPAKKEEKEKPEKKGKVKIELVPEDK
jgi:hypothetical protein